MLREAAVTPNTKRTQRLRGVCVLLVFGAPCQRNLLAGQEHGRTIPLADIGRKPKRCGL